MSSGCIGIVVSGGPAPGINGVISAATIEAINRGYQVRGLEGGFNFDRPGSSSVVKLTIDMVSRIANTGGSILGTSRKNPLATKESTAQFKSILDREKIDKLIVIGGDGSAYLSLRIADSFPTLAVVHVPKTIDNDLVLPNNLPSFGFETARSVGTEIIQTLLVDAKTCHRWYLAVTMGRSAGFLALGLGTAAGATLTIIPEEFPQKVKLEKLVEILVGSIKSRYAMGKPYGVAVLAEGLLDRIDPASSKEVANCVRDDLGRVNYAELDLGQLLLPAIRKKLSDEAVHVRINAKQVGYELRCHAPTSFDLEYTRLLGYGAVEALSTGKKTVMVVRDYDRLSYIPLTEMQAEDGRIRSRKVDLNSDLYRVSRSYMIRE